MARSSRRRRAAPVAFRPASSEQVDTELVELLQGINARLGRPDATTDTAATSPLLLEIAHDIRWLVGFIAESYDALSVQEKERIQMTILTLMVIFNEIGGIDTTRDPSAHAQLAHLEEEARIIGRSLRLGAGEGDFARKAPPSGEGAPSRS